MAAVFDSIDANLAASRCHPNPCENGGSCSDKDIGFECLCTSGYTGSKCEGKKIIYIVLYLFFIDIRKKKLQQQ